MPPDTTSQIVPGLWMSGSRAELATGRFDRVLTLCAERNEPVAVPEGSAPLVWRIPDAELEDGDRVREWARQIADWMDAGETVLVRCAAGLNRSGLVVARTLIERGLSPKEAVLLIREQRRADALNNPWFVEWLRHEGAATDTGDGAAERIPLPREVFGPQPFTRRWELDRREVVSNIAAAAAVGFLPRTGRGFLGTIVGLGILSAPPLVHRARFRHELPVLATATGVATVASSKPAAAGWPSVALGLAVYTGLRWLRLPSTRAERIWARRRSGRPPRTTAEPDAVHRETTPEA